MTPRPPPAHAFGSENQPRGRPWTAAEISALGSAPDRVIASRLGRSRASVIDKRIRLGIAAATGRGRPRKTRAPIPASPPTG
jgi:hypothetical protein